MDDYWVRILISCVLLGVWLWLSDIVTKRRIDKYDDKIQLELDKLRFQVWEMRNPCRVMPK